MTESKYVIVDGNELDFRPGETILQTARRAEIEIPVLCHDDRLTPAAACRICLVEVWAPNPRNEGKMVWQGVTIPAKEGSRVSAWTREETAFGLMGFPLRALPSTRLR